MPSPDQRQAILREAARGTPYNVIAQQFGLTKNAVAGIVYRDAYPPAARKPKPNPPPPPVVDAASPRLALRKFSWEQDA